MRNDPSPPSRRDGAAALMNQEVWTVSPSGEPTLGNFCTKAQRHRHLLGSELPGLCFILFRKIEYEILPPRLVEVNAYLLLSLKKLINSQVRKKRKILFKVA